MYNMFISVNSHSQLAKLFWASYYLEYYMYLLKSKKRNIREKRKFKKYEKVNSSN